MILGLKDGMVIQRNDFGFCDIHLFTDIEGPLSCCAVGPYGTSCDVSLCEAENKTRWREFRLTGLHVGGPHQLIIEAGADKYIYNNIYVGDVWLLGGQSNMDGAGVYREAVRFQEYNPNIRYYTVSGFWKQGGIQLHNNQSSDDKMVLKHLTLSEKRSSYYEPHCVGPGYFFAQEMYNRTGVPQGLIPAALGGSTLQQWNPELYDEDCPDLYHIAIRKIRESGGKIRGIFWYQGCSEGNKSDAPLFTDRMIKLISSFRSDLDIQNLAFVQVQIGSYVWSDKESDLIWSNIREQQRILGEKIGFLDTVSVSDAVLSDGIHLSSAAQRKLGIEAAEAMFHICYDRYSTESMAAPALDDVFPVPSIDSGFGTLAVRYKNIHGSLRAPGPATGYSFMTKDGFNDLRRIIRVDLYENTAYIRHMLSDNDLRNCYLYYDFGNNTYANITDGHERPLPAFGPLSPIG